MTSPNCIEIEIPSAMLVNYSDAEETIAYQQTLCGIYERVGGFGFGSTDFADIHDFSGEEAAALRREGRVWLREVRRVVETALESPLPPKGRGAADVPGLLEAYGAMHRVSFGFPCHAYLREMRLKAAERRARGDRSITATDVTLMLCAEMARDIRTLDRWYVDHCCRMIGRWVNELTERGRLSAPPREARKIMAFLLREDLYAYLGSAQAAAKCRWREAFPLAR